MAQQRQKETNDYTGLFLGVILGGLVAIVIVLMLAVGQSRARTALPLSSPTGGQPNSVLTPTLYFASRGTN